MSLNVQLLFDELAQNLSDYEACLNQEKQLLEEHTIEHYPELLKRKEALGLAIQKNQQTLVANKPKEIALKDFVKQLIDQQSDETQKELQDTWMTIVQRLTLCEALTLANGMVIQASRNMTNYFIDLITLRDKNRTYSKHAKTHSDIASTHSKRV